MQFFFGFSLALRSHNQFQASHWSTPPPPSGFVVIVLVDCTFKFNLKSLALIDLALFYDYVSTVVDRTAIVQWKSAMLECSGIWACSCFLCVPRTQGAFPIHIIQMYMNRASNTTIPPLNTTIMASLVKCLVILWMVN